MYSPSIQQCQELEKAVTIGHHGKTASHCSINLQRLLGIGKEPGLARQLLAYIINVVKLLRNMCKDRNRKLAKFA